MAEVQSPAELAASLVEYEEQLASIRGLLADEPGSAEYADLAQQLVEVIALTRDLLEAAGGEAAGGGGGAGAGAGAAAPAAVVGPSSLHRPSPLLVKTSWAPGEACSALFTDGGWHPAVVQSSCAAGFRVLFAHYAVPVVLPAASLRPPPLAGGAGEGVYVGVPAPRRPEVDATVLGKPLPRGLLVQPGDDERTRERKKRLAKAFKSKQRLAGADAEASGRAASWQAFRTGGKAARRAPGFLSAGTAKESMFRVQEGGRVGVGTLGPGKPQPAPAAAAAAQAQGPPRKRGRAGGDEEGGDGGGGGAGGAA